MKLQSQYFFQNIIMHILCLFVNFYCTLNLPVYTNNSWYDTFRCCARNNFFKKIILTQNSLLRLARQANEINMMCNKDSFIMINSSLIWGKCLLIYIFHVWMDEIIYLWWFIAKIFLKNNLHFMFSSHDICNTCNIAFHPRMTLVLCASILSLHLVSSLATSHMWAFLMQSMLYRWQTT